MSAADKSLIIKLSCQKSPSKVSLEGLRVQAESVSKDQGWRTLELCSFQPLQS